MRWWVLVAVGLLSCRPRPPMLAPGLERLELSARPLQWAEQGFVTLVSPIRPPTQVDGSSHIGVLLRVPLGAKLRFREGSFTMPRGAIALRVEFTDALATDGLTANSKVLDVRQFEWADAGLQCSVLRPASGGGSLVGVRWRCGAALDVVAGEALGDLVRARSIEGPGTAEARAAAAVRLSKLNGCTTCHVANKPEDRSFRALVQRSTDAEGLFSLRSLFRDEDPVERYRPADANLGDPLMEPQCPGSGIDFDAGRCADGLRARLWLDVRRGVNERNAHVSALCDSRRAVNAWLDEDGRDAVARSLAVCER